MQQRKVGGQNSQVTGPKAREEWVQSRIETIKISQDELREYFSKNQDNLYKEDAQKQKDQIVYWSKKIEQLDKKVSQLPS